MKRIIAMLLAVVMVFALCACSNGGDNGGTDAKDDGKVSLDFVTGGEQGTYFAFGTVLAQQVSDKTSTSVTALSSNGSQANVEDIASGNAQLGFVQSDVMSYAYNGEKLFTEKVTDFSVVAALYMEQVQIVTLNPDIKTVADLKGKTVCVGDVGSGTEINAWQVLGAAGLTKDDVNAVNGSFQDGVDQLKDGKIDAAFTVAGAPTTAIVDYATTNTLNLISLTDEELAAIQKAYPFLIRDDLPSTTYTGMTGDVVCVAIQATLVASKDLSEDVVYELVKAMFDNKDALTEGHAKFGFLDPEAASAGATVPMHPGAEKYYKEVGVL